MSTILEFENEGKKYKLEYTRGTAIKIGDLGFSLKYLDLNPMKQKDLLFHGAFLKHHPLIKLKETQELFQSVADEEDQDSLCEVLIEMYADAARTVTGGNAKWQVTKKSKS